MKIVQLDQGTDEWKQWRLTGIPASNAAAILPAGHPNKCKYKSTRTLFDLITGRQQEEDLSANPHVKRGVRNEPYIREHAEKVIDDFLTPLCAESSTHPHIRASFDGLSTLGIPFEFKSPSDKGWAEVCDKGENSDLIKRYMVQVQTQIFVAGADHAWMYFCAPDLSDFRSFRIERNDGLISEILDAAEKFMECVRNDTPPELDPDMDTIIPRGEALEDWTRQADEYRFAAAEIAGLKEKLKFFESRLEVAEEKLVSIADQYQPGWSKTEVDGVALTRSTRKGAIDYAKALKSMGITDDQVEPFRKEGSTSIRVTLKKTEVPKLVTDVEVIEEVAAAKAQENFYF